MRACRAVATHAADHHDGDAYGGRDVENMRVRLMLMMLMMLMLMMKLV